MITEEQIREILVSEALDHRAIGWLSDMAAFDLEYDEISQEIIVDGIGSIDIGHLAAIILDIRDGHFDPVTEVDTA